MIDLIDRWVLLNAMRDKSFSTRSLMLITDQPKVEAIPIEWIKDWYKKNVIYLDENKPLGKGLYAFEQMINQWERENNECNDEQGKQTSKEAI